MSTPAAFPSGGERSVHSHNADSAMASRTRVKHGNGLFEAPLHRLSKGLSGEFARSRHGKSMITTRLCSIATSERATNNRVRSVKVACELVVFASHLRSSCALRERCEAPG